MVKLEDDQLEELRQKGGKRGFQSLYTCRRTRRRQACRSSSFERWHSADSGRGGMLLDSQGWCGVFAHIQRRTSRLKTPNETLVPTAGVEVKKRWAAAHTIVHTCDLKR